MADWLSLKDRALDVTVRRLAEDGLRKAKQPLLPPPEIQAGALRIAHAFQPCDGFGGDGVGVVSLLDNRPGIDMLDVSGHGVGAALLSFTLAHLLSPTVEGSLLTERAGAGLPLG